MLRTIFAGIIGATAAIAASFVVVALLSAVGGVPVIYEPTRAEYGLEGAQIGMVWFIAIGTMMVWPFPVIALVGAAIGIAMRLALYKQSR